MKDIWKAVGILEDDVTENEHLMVLNEFVTKKMAFYERMLHVWLCYLPGSSFHQNFPKCYNWSLIEDGQFVPKGAPMTPEACKEKFDSLVAKLKLETLNSLQFDEQVYQAVVEILKIGKSAFPGMTINQPEVDLAVQWALKVGFFETIKSFISGKGEEKFQDDIWRELKDFDVLTVIKVKGFAPRPTVAVYTAGKSGSMIQTVDLQYNGTGAVKTVTDAVAKIKLQTRIIVSGKSIISF